MRDNTQHLYNNFELRKLLIPIIVEQLLSSLIRNRRHNDGQQRRICSHLRRFSGGFHQYSCHSGTVCAFRRGAILCSQYLGSQNKKMPTVLLGRFCLSWSFCL